jgi:hypothetical protein
VHAAAWSWLDKSPRCSKEAEPAALGDHELVAVRCDQVGFVEFGVAGELAGGGVTEDALAAGHAERVLLRLQVLVAGGDSGVADPHGSGMYRGPGVRDIAVYTPCVTVVTCGNALPISM